MILTYKIKHNQDFLTELEMARKIAIFALKTKSRSSKDVKHIGLKSSISNQILKKYSSNKKLKKINSVKLTVPGQSIKFENYKIKISCLKMEIDFEKDIEKINQIEIDKEFAYISCTVKEEEKIECEGWLGIDRNTTGHCAVIADNKNNKVMFLGKAAQHLHKKYGKIRKKLQNRKKLKKLKAIKRRESNIQKNINHKISKKIVNYAKNNKCGIKLEKLKGIRQTTKQAKSFKYSMNSWAYFQLEQFIEYKAQLAGVSVVYVDPAYTSQTCHKCRRLGNRNGKVFKCPHCGYTSHADVNASWNISYSEKLWVEPKAEHRAKSGSCQRQVYSPRLMQEGVCIKGNTDIPQGAMAMQMQPTLEPLWL